VARAAAMLRPRSFAPRRAAPRHATDPSRPASVPSNLYCTSGCKAGTWRGRSNGAETLDWRWQGRRRDALAGRRRSRLARAWAGGGLIFRRVSPAATPQVRSRVSTGATVNPTLSRRGAALAGRRHSRLACACCQRRASLSALAGRCRSQLVRAWAGGGLISPAVAALNWR